MIAAGQDLWDADPTEFGRSRVLRILEQALGERLLDRRLRVDRPRQKPEDSVDDDERRQLPAAQDIVSDRQFEVDHRPDPLIDALIAGADEDEVRSLSQCQRPRMTERLACRIEQDDRRVRAAQRSQGVGDRFGPDDHPRSPTVGLVVDRAMTADPPGPQIVDPDGRQATLLDPARDAVCQRAFEHPREEAQDVDVEAHRRSASGLDVGVGRRSGGDRPAARPRQPADRPWAARRRSPADPPVVRPIVGPPLCGAEAAWAASEAAPAQHRARPHRPRSRPDVARRSG